MPKKKVDPSTLVATQLQKHFGATSLADLVTACRYFPATARVDLQRALDDIFAERYTATLLGLHRHYDFASLTFSSFLDGEQDPVILGPLQHDELDIGEEHPARCLKEGLWISTDQQIPFAILLVNPERGHSDDRGTGLSIAVPPGEMGLQFSRSFFEQIEKLVNRSSSYRGKVISLEEGSRYSGRSGTVRVHKLRSVAREDVILPPKTLQLLERNVTEFIQQRQNFKELGLPIKKGLLFYGLPGTGKTHTIHYLASQLPEHTTLLITAAQVGLLSEYFLLARFLQPAMVVIEDADLIARDRESMNGPCEESLLNRLLNEMDGLREDAAILFVLTTNRPEHLEAALASRPGRIDQAIEFPLPDEDGRRKLVRLYSKGLVVDDDLLNTIVTRTERASAAFIKELMRRSAQCLLHARCDRLLLEHVNLALDDMLFSGGTLNVKLLGGAIGG